MSFRFKTRPAHAATMGSMKPTTPSRCPFDAGHTPVSPTVHAPGSWPPGPPAGLTGWGLLLRMSRDLPGALDAWRRQCGDLVHLRIWPEHQLIVTDPQLVRQLLVGHHEQLGRWERGVDVLARIHGGSVFVAEGAAWQARRRALQPTFLPGQVAAFVPTIAAAGAQALAGWEAGDDPVDMGGAVTEVAMDVIMRRMFSCAIGAQARRAESAVRTLGRVANAEMFWPVSWPDWLPWKWSKRRAIGTMRSLIDQQIKERLALAPDGWPDDLLGRLLALQRASPEEWPLAAVRDECMTAFLAGHETTAATLTWWLWCMAANPDAQAAARSEVQRVLGARVPGADDLPRLAFLRQTLQETLRLYPAAPVLFTRRTLAPIVMQGWTIPPRTMVTIPPVLMQRDARWFPEPEAFRPERFADTAAKPERGAFMPFGAGPRVCLGQHLALAELTVIAALILQRFAVSTLPGQAPPRPVLNVTWRTDRPLRLKLERVTGKAPG